MAVWLCETATVTAVALHTNPSTLGSSVRGSSCACPSIVVRLLNLTGSGLW